VVTVLDGRHGSEVCTTLVAYAVTGVSVAWMSANAGAEAPSAAAAAKATVTRALLVRESSTGHTSAAAAPPPRRRGRSPS
jgi:hypothetical protein